MGLGYVLSISRLVIGACWVGSRLGFWAEQARDTPDSIGSSYFDASQAVLAYRAGLPAAAQALAVVACDTLIKAHTDHRYP